MDAHGSHDVVVRCLEHVLGAGRADETSDDRPVSEPRFRPLPRQERRGGHRRGAGGDDEPGRLRERVRGPLRVDEQDDAGPDVRDLVEDGGRVRSEELGGDVGRGRDDDGVRLEPVVAGPHEAAGAVRDDRGRACVHPQSLRTQRLAEGRRQRRTRRRRASRTSGRPPRRAARRPSRPGSGCRSRAPSPPSSGNVARTPRRSTSPANRPASSGATSRSVASSPRRLRRSEPSGSSPSDGLDFRTRSVSARARPRRDNPGHRASSSMSAGIPSALVGSGTSPREVHAYAPRDPGSISSSPSSRQSSTAHGLRATNESGPASSSSPPTAEVASRPPGCGSASSTVTSSSGSDPTSRYAAVRPATPPPTTTTRAPIGGIRPSTA